MTHSNKPVTKVLIDYEEKQSLVAFATTLETIAKKLKEDGAFHFVQGEQTIPIIPGEMVEGEFKYEVKGDKHSFEIELEWYEGVHAKQSMKIE